MFSIKVLDLDLFQMLKNISVYFLDIFENEERLSEKQRLFVLPSPVPQTTCIRPQLICGSFGRER